MKKVLAVISVLILLCGCTGQKTEVKPVTKGLSFSCDVTYYNESYECDCDIQKNGDMTVEFTFPSEISGMVFSFSKNGVSANYKGLEYINDKVVFESSVATLINDIFTTSNGEVVKKDDIFYAEGMASEFEYKLELGQTGLPIKAVTRPDAAEIVFKKVKIK